MRRINLAGVICALAALNGCAAPTGTVLKLKPPVDLLQDCVPAAYPLRTNADLTLAILAERRALALCNNDKAALREWAKD